MTVSPPYRKKEDLSEVRKVVKKTWLGVGSGKQLKLPQRRLRNNGLVIPNFDKQITVSILWFASLWSWSFNYSLIYYGVCVVVFNLLVSISPELSYTCGSSKLVLNSIGNLLYVIYSFCPKEIDCAIYQTGPSDFNIWVLKWIFCESTSMCSPGCYCSLL
jgi:hypothetical protein